MPTVYVPHRNKNKGGATEHVDAIIDILRTQYADVIIAPPIENSYGQIDGKETLLPLQAAARNIYAAYGNANYIVITGDYGADRCHGGKTACAEIRHGLGSQTQIVMSTYSVEPRQILPAVANGTIDYLAVPTHAVDASLLDIAANQIVRDAGDRIVRTVGIPNEVTPATCADVRRAWDATVNDGKVQSLPHLLPYEQLTIIMLPGDAESPDGKPVLFTVQDAERLADGVADHLPNKLNKVLLSNGPRTWKYNADLLDAPDFDACNPAFHNKMRFKGLNANPVASAFYERLAARIGENNIIDGCIAKGVVPRQGYLAFIDYANAHAVRGGAVAAFIDGASSITLTQFIDNLHPAVSIIACDTPAKTATHTACMRDRYNRDEASILELKDGAYNLQRMVRDRSAETRPTDAEYVAGKIVGLAPITKPVPRQSPTRIRAVALG